MAVGVTAFMFLVFILGDMNGIWEWVTYRVGPVLLMSWAPFYALVALVRARRKRAVATVEPSSRDALP